MAPRVRELAQTFQATTLASASVVGSTRAAEQDDLDTDQVLEAAAKGREHFEKLLKNKKAKCG